MARHFQITADGGSRGNPGPAAYGAVVTEDGKILAELFATIGVASNNVAEYSGLIAGLEHAHHLDPQATIDVKMDSKLVVEQMSGRWQIKHPDMRELAKRARDAHPISLVTFSWIPRDQNSHADRLANKALDGDLQDPQEKKLIQKNFLHSRLISQEVPTTIYLIRHGETPLTPERRFSGSGGSNPGLTEKGREQARAVGRELAARKPEVLLVSPMQRTRDTAEEMMNFIDLQPIFDEDWIEASFGKWDGLTPDEVEGQFPEEFKEWVADAWYPQGGGEPYAAVSERAGVALNKVAAQYPGQTVAIVTHNVVVKGAVCIALQTPIDSIFHVDVAPCSITTIKIWPSDGLMALMSMSERAISSH
jgi:ribonuclease H / adenosylcobalamin/alpha-ribazole phosphatase